MNLGLSACIGVAAVLLMTSGVASILYQYSRLRHINGPLGAGFSNWWLLRAIYSGRSHLYFCDAHVKYGPLVRVGPNDVITSDPDLVRRVLNVRTEYGRSNWYDALRLDPVRDNILSARNDAIHSQLRSRMAAGYSGKQVEGLEFKIDENIRRFIRLIEGYVSNGAAFDLGVKTQYFTLDVISDLAFDAPFGDLHTDSDVHGYIQSIERAMPRIIVFSVLPWLRALLSSRLFRRWGPSDEDAVGIGKIIGIAKQVASKRFGPERTIKKDMLGSFIAHGLSMEEASSEILMQILAGSDTTATAIRATLLHIITDPVVRANLRAEIERTKPSWPVIKQAEARRMPYLQAVIKEGLRIFPPVAGQMSKTVPKGGDTFKGTYLPGGTRLGVGVWAMFRRVDVWGLDAGEFRPERWLRPAGEELKLMEETMELVFGHGKWKCLGRSIAMLELQKVLVELLRRYDFTVVDPTQPWESLNYGIFVQSQFWVRGHRLHSKTGDASSAW